MEYVIISIVVAVVLVAVISGINEKEAEKRRKELAEASDHIKFVTKREEKKGYTRTNDLGWVSAYADSQQEAEDELKVLAFRKGANAISDLRYEVKSARKLEGYSKNGNPYYVTERNTYWEARAIKVEKQIGRVRSAGPEAVQATEGDDNHKASGFSGAVSCCVNGSIPSATLIVIDGNNVVLEGLCHDKPKILKATIDAIKRQGRPFHVYMDPDAYILIFGRRSRSKRYQEEIASYLSIDLDQFSMTKGRDKADPHLLLMAKNEKAIVLSNDKFDQYVGEHPWIANPGRRIGISVARTSVNVPALNIYVDYTSYSSPRTFEQN